MSFSMNIVLSDRNKAEINVLDLMPTFSMESLESLPDSVVLKDPEGRYINCNDAAIHALKIPKKDELINKFAQDFNWGKEPSKWRENDLKVISTNQAMQCFEEIVHDNHKHVYVATIMPVYHCNKNIGTLKLLKFQKLIELSKVSNSPIASREIECLYYLIKGFSLKEIGQIMQISSRTVEHHIKNSKIKLKCLRRSELIAKASQLSSIKKMLLSDETNLEK